MSLKLLIGADPETFLQNPNSGALIGPHELRFPGTKEEPFSVRHGAVQIDGLAAEFNIEPAESADAFVYNLSQVMDQMRAMVPGYNILCEPVAEFSREYFDTVPGIYKELGCNPDFDAWEGRANIPPNADTTMRTASGHIHIGWTNGADPQDSAHLETCERLVRQLDYYVGLPSLRFDPDPRRRAMYGKAGCYRPKSYGVEYRVLSNAWLRDEQLQRFVYNATIKGCTDLFDKRLDAVAKFGDAARWAINEGVDVGFDPFEEFGLEQIAA